MFIFLVCSVLIMSVMMCVSFIYILIVRVYYVIIFFGVGKCGRWVGSFVEGSIDFRFGLVVGIDEVSINMC